MRKFFIWSTIVVAYCVIPCSTAVAQHNSLRQAWQNIIGEHKAEIGIAVLDPVSRDTISYGGNHRYPMQSVYKFPLGLAVLEQVDKGKLTLDQKIHITKADLLENTWSPLREKYPQGNVDVTIRELLVNTVGKSDNNGCDILFRLLGGPSAVEAYVRRQGITNMSIVSTEEMLHMDWDEQFKNWSTPAAMVRLLEKFYAGRLLSKTSYDFLWQTMVETTTGANRIVKQLPAGTVVAHKTGTGFDDSHGIGAINDVGVIVLPNGKPLIIAVFFTRSPESPEVAERTIAALAKAAYDEFVKAPSR